MVGSPTWSMIIIQLLNMCHTRGLILKLWDQKRLIFTHHFNSKLEELFCRKNWPKTFAHQINWWSITINNLNGTNGTSTAISILISRKILPTPTLIIMFSWTPTKIKYEVTENRIHHFKLPICFAPAIPKKGRRMLLLIKSNSVIMKITLMNYLRLWSSRSSEWWMMIIYLKRWETRSMIIMSFNTINVDDCTLQTFAQKTLNINTSTLNLLQYTIKRE